MFYIVNSGTQQIIEFADLRPTLEHVGKLARANRIDLYVIEGELAGITYTHLESEPPPDTDGQVAYTGWQLALGYDAWKLEKKSRKDKGSTKF